MTGAIRKFLAENPEEFDPRSYLTLARDAMKDVIKSRMLSFGEVGNRGDYEPLALEVMARRYAEEANVN